MPPEEPMRPQESTSAPQPLGVAMIGYAFMGKAHSNAWRNVASFFHVPAFEQRVLVGRDPEGAVEAAQRYGWAQSATDWRAIVARDDIHVVDICAPGLLHAEIALAALAAGKHVLVEKPLANTLGEAEAMAAAALGSAVPRCPVNGGASTTAGFPPWLGPAS